jgi:hypothetical protein
MKTTRLTAIFSFAFALFTANTFAQTTNTQQNGTRPITQQTVDPQQSVNQQQNGQTNVNKGVMAGDTVTYHIYGSDLSFDTKRTIVYDDKANVDSLAKLLGTANRKHYQLIYKKDGKQAKAITVKELHAMDKSNFYKITIAYNKQQLSEDASPLYIISSK